MTKNNERLNNSPFRKLKGLLGYISVIGLILATQGCGNTIRPVSVIETREHPTWYVESEQIGAEGFIFFNRSQWAHSCGMGQSRYEQASEAQTYAFAIKGFAERINGQPSFGTCGNYLKLLSRCHFRAKLSLIKKLPVSGGCATGHVRKDNIAI